MKKTVFLFSLLCLFCASNLFAGNPISVKSGNIAVLKNVTKVLFEIDDSSATVGGKTLEEYLKGRGEDFVRDWPQDKAKAASSFKAQFNKKNKKGAQFSTDDSQAEYKMIVYIKNLDMGDPVNGLLWGGNAGGCIMIGTADIIDLKTNNVVCNIYIDEVKGAGTFSESLRFAMTFNELALSLCKVVKKAK